MAVRNELSWEGLPSEYTPFISFFMKYGEYQFEERMIRVLNHLTPEEVRSISEIHGMLASLSVQTKDAIDQWIDEMGIVHHLAARRAYFALCFLATGHDFSMW